MPTAASVKRPRALTAENDEQLGRFRREKRHRTFNSPRNDDSQQSTEDEMSEDEQNNAQDDEQIVWATQQVQRDFQKTTNQQNVATDSGIIEEIQCINFMCHEHLTVSLGPLINFIIGHNGSGKSAVLTALTICLGGKATATNRAQNLKSLIKEGKDHSSVQVRIKNQGLLAYKPLQYGDSIIVERHFNRTGTSGFKIKDQNGRIISTKKAELEDILDAFSMQIDNPMNVLTQDMARQFLNHSTPKDKYKFFLQGTQLENLNRDYQQIESYLELMNARAEVKESDLTVLRKRMEDLASKARRAESLERMRAREKQIAHQIAWAHVEEKERALQSAQAELARIVGIITQRSTVVNEASERFERADRALEGAQQQVREIVNDLDPAQQRKHEQQERLDDGKAKLLTLKADERKIMQDISSKEAEVRKYRSDIEQHRQRQTQADNGLFAQKACELEAAKTEFNHARQIYTAYEGERKAMQQLQKVQDDYQTAKNRVEKSREAEKRIQNNISILHNGEQRWMDAYPKPPGLQRLLRAIENDQRFSEKPIGPLGRHVRLVRPEWGYILEKQFGSALNNFVVTNKRDRDTLSELMGRCDWHASVIIGNRTPIDTTPQEPDSNMLTWMRALKFDDTLVRNTFIINNFIEQTVLIENQDEGRKFFYDRGPLTRNVKMCFTFANGDKQRGRTLNYTANGGINDSPIGSFQGVFRMQADKEDQINGEQSHLEIAQQQTKFLSRQVQETLDEIQACKSQMLDATRRKKQLQLDLQLAQDAVDRIESELSEATPDAAAIEVLEDSLTKAQEEQKVAEGAYEDVIIQRDKLRVENRICQANNDEACDALKDVEFRLNKAQATVREYQGRREDELKQKNKAISQVEAAEENRQQWENACTQAQGEVEKTIAEAETVCQERVAVPPTKTADELGKMLQKLMATRRETEKELGGSQDELLRQANEAKRTHKEAMQEFEDVRSLRGHLINTLNNRRNRWRQFRSGISVRARVTFNYLLSERKFRGTLSIDHTKNLLDIHVQPDITERSGDVRQTKTLSGGEKSYSTVCLLLSLWDAMGSPIRCLDEFDVFMDSVNRERSMIMIIQAARRSIGRQFIFITPQSMNNINQDSDVKIIRMSDPERGQTALNFS